MHCLLSLYMLFVFVYMCQTKYISGFKAGDPLGPPPMMCIINQGHLESLALFDVLEKRSLENLELVSSDYLNFPDIHIDDEIEAALEAQKLKASTNMSKDDKKAAKEGRERDKTLQLIRKTSQNNYKRK